MNVIEIPLKIGVRADHMLPSAALPLASFAFALPAGGNSRACRNVSGEIGFQQPPAQRKIIIAFRQYPEAMQVFR